MKRRYAFAGLGVVALLALTSPVLAGPSLAKLVKKEVAKQLRGKTGPQGPAGPAGPLGPPGADGDPATALWAVISPGTTPAIARGSGAISVTRGTLNPAQQGVYEIKFDRSVTSCSTAATSQDTLGYNAISFTDTDFPAQAGLDADEVYVETKNQAGTPSDARFNVQVFC